jgi:hypothetical protein
LTIAELKNACFRVEEVLDRFVVDLEVGDGEGKVDFVGAGGDAGEEVLHDEEDDARLGGRAGDGVGFAATSCLRMLSLSTRVRGG